MSTPQNETTEPAFRIGEHAFHSRLIVGTGKYESFEQNLECARESGAEMITVALRRVNFDADKGPRLLDVIKPSEFTILPNTAGCYTADDAVTTAQMGRELLEGLELGGKRVAVAVNRDVVIRSRHGSHRIADGDRIEILEAVGGG